MQNYFATRSCFALLVNPKTNRLPARPQWTPVWPALLPGAKRDTMRRIKHTHRGR